MAYDNGKAVITLKIKNEGLDTQHFDMRLKIAATDKKGRNARKICGKSFLIKSGSFEDIIKSVKRLASLDGDRKVYPGHNMLTTLDNERKHNVYLKDAK